MDVRLPASLTIQGVSASHGANVFAGINTVIHHTAPALSDEERQRPQWMVPRNVSTLFTGREETLKRLQDALLPSDAKHEQPRKQKRFVLCGPGGVGKSEVCLKFANSVRNKFWGIFWVEVSNRTIAENRFTQFAKKSGGLEQDFEGAKEWLANTDKEWLLVLDNADDLNVDYSVYFPSGDTGAILITTRNEECEIHQTVGYESLGVLETEASTTLLLKAIGIPETSRQRHEEAAGAVVKTLGSHTLAIVQAGAYVKKGYCPLEKYPEIFTTNRNRLLRFQRKQASSAYGDVYATFEVSAIALETLQEPGAADALELLSILAFMYHERVPIEVFKRAWKCGKKKTWSSDSDTSTVPEPYDKSLTRMSQNASKHGEEDSWQIPTDTASDEDFCLGEMSNWHVSRLPRFLPISMPEWDEYQLRYACNLLASFSIVRLDGAAGSTTLSMHPLAHAWAGDRMTALEQKVVWETVGALLGLSADGCEDWDPFWRALQPHIHSYLEKPLTERSPDRQAMHFAVLLRCAGVLSWLSDVKKVSSPLLDMLQRIKEGYDMTSYESLVLDKLVGEVHVWLGRYHEAVLLLEKTLETARKTLNSEHEFFMTNLLYQLAVAYGWAGRSNQAIEVLEQVVGTQRTRLNPEDPYRLKLESELAKAYVDIGEYEQAVELLEHVANIQAITVNPEHPNRLTAVFELGKAYLKAGQMEQALEPLEQVVNVRSTILDAKDRDRLKSERFLALAYLKTGRNNQAVELLEHVANTLRTILDPKDRIRLLSERRLAQAYLKDGQIWRAVVLLEENVAVISQTLSAKDPDRLASEHYLARAYLKIGQIDEATELLEHVAAIERLTLDPKHPHRLDSEHYLGKTYLEIGRVDEAVKLLEHVAAIESSTLEAGLGDRLASERLLRRAKKAQRLAAREMTISPQRRLRYGRRRRSLPEPLNWLDFQPDAACRCSFTLYFSFPAPGCHCGIHKSLLGLNETL